MVDFNASDETSFSSTGQDTEPLWTVSDVARYLVLEPETIRQMAREGQLPSIKVGKRIWRFRKSEIIEWLDNKSKQP